MKHLAHFLVNKKVKSRTSDIITNFINKNLDFKKTSRMTFKNISVKCAHTNLFDWEDETLEIKKDFITRLWNFIFDLDLINSNEFLFTIFKVKHNNVNYWGVYCEYETTEKFFEIGWLTCYDKKEFHLEVNDKNITNIDDIRTKFNSVAK